MRVESSSVKAFSRPCQGLCAAFISALLLPLTLGAQTTQAHYIWKNVTIRGGGFVSGIVFSPAQKGLVYARTDVGGAYRSDDAGEHWIPLTDAFTREQSTYHGIESLAVDPTDPNKVYLAAGMYSGDWGGPAGILRSSDKGRNWTLAPLPLKMGGNDDGRNCGEKLAVDPNLPSVLYFGSRKAGLWRSRDSGASWSKVESFPVKEKVPEPWTQVGITFVLFDQTKGAKGAATPSVYVGVAQAGASLYKSDDAGRNWHVVPGLPSKMFPSHAKLDPAGAIYFSFIDNIGPNGITDGAILKYTTADGKLADISPVKPGSGSDGRKFGFGGIGMDPEHPATIMVTTLDRWWPSDSIYRSTDGGRHWKELNTDAQFSAPNVPWVYWHRDKTGGTGWMSDIEIDPFNPSKVMYTTGEGIWGSADVTEADRGKPTHWGFPNDGLEEVVPIALISPTEGAHLLSGVGDIGGFRHDDLTKSPAGGFFDDPRFTNTDSLDYATQKPSLIVRVGRGGEKIVHGAYSTDGGTKWHEFASEPPTSKFGSGHVAISSDGAVVVWTPERGRAFWTDNMGKSWTPTGLADSVDVVSDRVNPNKFYAFDNSSGTLYESGDKAKTFHGRGGPLGPPSKGLFLIATPGKEGDIWLATADNLYHSADSGGHFTMVEEMHKVYQLGFGKSAAGQSYPAMYLAGEWKGKDAIYRSDDAGRSWVRINDDAHQYGWIGPITGDPRVYGRVYFGTGGRGVIYGDLADEAAAGSAGGH
jgi:photosystem II stability/assembly factor-like uncharacterized protein